MKVAENKEKIIIIRVDKDFHLQAKKMATKTGYTLSEYARMAILRQIIRDKKLGY